MTVSPAPADFRPASPVQGTHSVIERNWNELIRPEKPQIESGADGQRKARLVTGVRVHLLVELVPQAGLYCDLLNDHKIPSAARFVA